MEIPSNKNPFENPQPENGGRNSLLNPMVRNIIFFSIVSMGIILGVQFLSQNKEMKSKEYAAPVFQRDRISVSDSTKKVEIDEEAMLDTMSYEQIKAYKKRKAK